MNLKPGDRVRVTRRPKDGPSSTVEGTVATVAPNGGFSLREDGYFTDSATLQRLYGCEQTIEVLTR